MLSAGFELVIPAVERPRLNALLCTATAIG